jgi:hypothetical protein
MDRALWVVPICRRAATALFLHNLNACLRIGAFYLNPELRLIVYRLTMPVRPEAELGHQFGEAFATALGTWDDYLPPWRSCSVQSKPPSGPSPSSLRRLMPARRCQDCQ